MNKTILVTGGTGFIGSHTSVVLFDAGYNVVALDNLCNSEQAVIGRIGQICGREPEFVEGDIRDAELLDRKQVEPLLNEANELTAIMVASRKSTRQSINKSKIENRIRHTNGGQESKIHKNV